MEKLFMRMNETPGKYNRANRSMNHFIENSMTVGLAVLMSSYVFPFPTLVTTCVFAFGRIAH